MSFIKNNIYVIAGALCVMAVCVLYFARQGQPPSEGGLETIEVQGEVIYDSADEPPDEIMVYISGEVVSPGVYTVPYGARLERVLEEAGGFTADAASDRVNLAAYVEDAQHIVVPSLASGSGLFAAADSDTMPGEAISGEASGVAENGVVNINTATSEQLQTLPGIGEIIASYIIDYREEHGGFKSIDEIINVSRIGAVTFEKIKDRITIQ